MDQNKRKALQAAGWAVGDTADLLRLSDKECRIANLRAEVAIKIRERRKHLHFTQSQLARKMGSSQSRVAKMEAGSPDVSLDLMISRLYAMGCRIEIVSTPAPAGQASKTGTASRPRRAASRRKPAASANKKPIAV